MCDLAYQAIERGDHDQARSILSSAATANAEVQSPRVFLYIANLAAITGDLHAALAAQKELLRLEPDDRLARRNFAHLLTVPSAEFTERAVRAPA
jgi:lipopolysaccharide biosynthesis regulator YciM